MGIEDVWLWCRLWVGPGLRRRRCGLDCGCRRNWQCGDLLRDKNDLTWSCLRTPEPPAEKCPVKPDIRPTGGAREPAPLGRLSPPASWSSGLMSKKSSSSSSPSSGRDFPLVWWFFLLLDLVMPEGPAGTIARCVVLAAELPADVDPGGGGNTLLV